MHEVQACKSRERPASASRKLNIRGVSLEQDAIRHQTMESTKQTAGRKFVSSVSAPAAAPARRRATPRIFCSEFIYHRRTTSALRDRPVYGRDAPDGGGSRTGTRRNSYLLG
ncbi:hypothetical protein EVAR_89547_1 [Eumeta japonica]|uniref:Uncharacterized protein n=1 Tax=Eumeta variegata TaxID=151549 RepID=A0A4C1ZBR4_EUMVA|nr:hypothetical protein EVAR_89547_1 [Eumeta japonica]